MRLRFLSLASSLSVFSSGIALAGACALVTGACAFDAGSTAEPVASTSVRIIHGVNSDDTQNSVVLIQNTDSSAGWEECSGTLLTPNLVLTARHCVSDTSGGGIECGADGNPIGGGGKFGTDLAPNLIGVSKGLHRPTGPANPDARATKIFHDNVNTICNHDLALILLDAPLYFGATIAPVRLTGDEKKGDTLTAVGWGITDRFASPEIRQQRTGVPIVSVGPAPMVAPNSFLVGEDFCHGDSGGPAFDTKTGAVIGVTSYGGGGSGANGQPAQGCVGPDTTNWYMKVAPFKNMIVAAAKESGFDLWIEGQPDPRKAKFGESCESSDKCQSNFCISSTGAGADGGVADTGKVVDSGVPANFCTQTCSADKACPDRFDCTQVGSDSLCTLHVDAPPAPPPADTGGKSGCSTPAAPPSVGWASIATLVGAALALARGRRSKR